MMLVRIMQLKTAKITNLFLLQSLKSKGDDEYAPTRVRNSRTSPPINDIINANKASFGEACPK